ncbi:MAG: sialidase family protein, partial [Acidobacteriota bacterium]
MPARQLLPILVLLSSPTTAQPPAVTLPDEAPAQAVHDERPDDAPIVVPREARVTSPARIWRRGAAASVQVNVDENGDNIVGDAANEPSIAVDLNNSNRIAIGWRQFDTITSNFRQAGWGYTDDGGQSWSVSVIEPGIFRSDPVLDSDADGNFYYNSLGVPGGDFVCDVFRSADGGATWDGGVFANGGDKQWMAIDRTGGLGSGHIYSNWSQFASCCGPNSFTRSTDGGDSYETPISIPTQPVWGTTAVGPTGEVYVAGNDGGSISVIKSTTLRDPGLAPAFDSNLTVDLGGTAGAFGGPNPGGLVGQVWVAVDSGLGPRSGWVYVLMSVDPPGADPLDVHLVRSEDGGATWSAPIRINDDPAGSNTWQWFGTLAVAPNGRLDAIWNDTRDDPGGFDSVLYYSFSEDGGVTWSANEPVSPSFDPHLGWPQQNKIGDYYDMVSENDAVHVAYSATFNGEQDVYYLRLRDPGPIFEDGFESG